VSATSDRPWLASYADGVPADITVTAESLCDLLDTAVTRFGPQIALDFYGATTTFAELGEQVARIAGSLKALGIKPGDRVAIILPNCPQHVIAFYAVLRLGAIVVETNPLYTADELAYQLADSGACLAIAWDVVVPTIDGIRSQTSITQVIAVNMTTALPRTKRITLRLPVAKARTTRAAMTAPAPGALRWKKVLADGWPLHSAHARPAASDLAVLQYTGGTTGVPKGAMLTHRNLLANAAQGRAWVPGLTDGGEVVYAVLPLFHAYGLTLCLTFAISIGATLVLFPRFDAEQVLEAMRRRPATFLPGVPPIYSALADAAVKSGVGLHSIRYAISGAMPLPTTIVDHWEATTGGLLVEGYGMTETSPVTIGNPIAPSRRPGTVGVPFPSTDIRIVDPANPDQDTEDDDAGELLVRGPQVFAGYWNRPEDTEGVLLEGGWIRTGDIVVMDSDGFVTIVDRIKELIITGGFNVYPSQVEEVLRQIDGVLDAAVVGLPDGSGGERVVAAIVCEPDLRLDPEQVREEARLHLTAYKVPRQVFIVDELPRSMIGKVLRRKVREQLLEHPDRR
jgi:long-chain acyl-CoA synthetase